ncbi:MAG: glycosyltransferase family 4 protein [Tepidisphaeraceae bacterium]|jgi:glycosyltransferase involved in cell wall biosynthesis
MGRSQIEHPWVAMIQDGARLHYLVPLALQNAGILDRVFIDWFVREGSIEEKIAGLGGKFLRQMGRKMAERRCPELDPARVIRNPFMALGMRLRMPRFARSEDSFIWASRQTAKWVIRKGFGDANVLYGFIRNAAPEAYRAAKARGLLAVGDQMIAPLEVEVAEMQRQIQRWPGWIGRETADLHQEYLEFERETWETLDGITCASDYVREGLISRGIAPERISVIPYPWPHPSGDRVERQRKSGPLVVGFVGAVGLRKGAGYFLETARRFDPAKMKFVMVGNVLLDQGKLEPYAQRVQFVGPVPRSTVADWLGKFDVFFFPSTCEGSAGAVMEAMGAGLAVLTTHNSGSRVRDGIDGFIRSCDDIDGFEQALRNLDDDRDLLLRMGESARARVLAYDLNAYQSELSRFFQGLPP